MSIDYSLISQSLVDVAMGHEPAEMAEVRKADKLIGLAELTIAGLMSQESSDIVA